MRSHTGCSATVFALVLLSKIFGTQLSTTTSTKETISEGPIPVPKRSFSGDSAKLLREELNQVPIKLGEESLRRDLKDIIVKYEKKLTLDDRIEALFETAFQNVHSNMSTITKVELGLWLMKDVIVSTVGFERFEKQLDLSNKKLSCKISRKPSSELSFKGAPTMRSTAKQGSEKGLLIHMVFEADKVRKGATFFTMLTSDVSEGNVSLSATPSELDGFLGCGEPRNETKETSLCSQNGALCVCPSSPHVGAPHFYTGSVIPWKDYLNGSTNPLDLIERITVMNDTRKKFSIEDVLDWLKEPFSRLLASDQAGVYANILVSFFFSEIVQPRMTADCLESLKMLLAFSGDILFPNLSVATFRDQKLKLPSMEVSLSKSGTSVLGHSSVLRNKSEPLLHIELSFGTQPLESFNTKLTRMVWVKAKNLEKTVSFPLGGEQVMKYGILQIPVCASFSNLSDILSSNAMETNIPSIYTETNVACSTNGSFIGIMPKQLNGKPFEITFHGGSMDALKSLTALFRRFGSSRLQFFETRFPEDILTILENRTSSELLAVPMVYEEIILPAFQSAGSLNEINSVYSFSIKVSRFVPNAPIPDIKITQGKCNFALSNKQTSLLFTMVVLNGTPAKPIHHVELQSKDLNYGYHGPLVLVNVNLETNYTVSFRIESETIHKCGSFNLSSKNPEFMTTTCRTLSFAKEISCVCPGQSFIGIKEVTYAEAIKNAKELEELTQIGKLIHERETVSLVEKYFEDLSPALTKLVPNGSQVHLEKLVSELLLPDLHKNEAGIQNLSFDRILRLLLSVAQQEEIGSRSFGSLGLSINMTYSNHSKLGTTEVESSSPENRLIHIEIDAHAFPGVFQANLNKKLYPGHLVSKLIVLDHSENPRNFKVWFDVKGMDDSPSHLASCFSMYEGELDATACETYSFMSSRVLCKCTLLESITYFGVRRQDFNTVLGDLQHVDQLTTLLKNIHSRHGVPQAMYQEFSPMLSRAEHIIRKQEKQFGETRASDPLIDFVQATNEIFNAVFKNVKTIKNALSEVSLLHNAYEVFMDLGLNPEDPELAEEEQLSIALAQRDSETKSTSLRNTTVRLAGEDLDVPYFAHIVINRSLYRDTVLPLHPDAERSRTDLVHVVSRKTQTPRNISVEFSDVPHPPDSGLQCGLLTEEGPNRKKCQTKLEDGHVSNRDHYTVECRCRDAGPYMVLATPYDVIMRETTNLGGLLNFTSLLYPRRDTDFVWRHERTFLEKLSKHLKKIERDPPAPQSEILKPFIHMFESSINDAKDILRIFGVLETVEATIRDLLKKSEEGTSEGDGKDGALVGRRPEPIHSQEIVEGLTASFPSANVTDIDGRDRESFWLYVEINKTLPVYRELIDLGGNPTFIPCSPLLNVYGDFARSNIAIPTECSNRARDTELRCTRLNFRASSGMKLFTTDGCNTNSFNGGVVHCDCTAPGPYLVFAIPRRELFNMETNSSAVVALAEHFVKQHHGIGPLMESQSSFFKRLETITMSLRDNGAEEAVWAFSSRLVPEILFRSSNESFEELINFSREFTVELSKHLTAPVESSNSLIAFHVGNATTTNHTIALSSMSLSHQGQEDDYTVFRELPRKYVSYLDEKLVSDIVDVAGGTDRPKKPSLDLIFEMNPRFRREKHLPRCIQLPETDPPSCVTLQISENVVCRCEGPGTFGVVLRDFAHVAERFLDTEMMIRDSKWILSHSFDSLIEVKESFKKGLQNLRGRISDGGESQTVPRMTAPNAVSRALYEQLLPASLDKAETVANFSALLNFFRELNHDSVQSATSLQKYLPLFEPRALSDDEISRKSSIVRQRDLLKLTRGMKKPQLNDQCLPFLAVSIPASLLQRFGLSNGSVALTTDLREVILPSSGSEKIIVKFVDFRRVRHGDVKCVWFDTTNRYFDANGCEIQKRNGTELVCQCDQPRAIAVVVVPFESYFILNVFSAIAIAINLLCLAVCVIFLYHVPEDYSLKCLFRFHQCSALLLGQGVLIASTVTVQSAPVFEPCNALVGFLLQFSFLVAAAFIGFEAIEVLKQAFLVSLSPPISGRKRFIFLGYGIPLLIASLCFGLKSTYLGSYQLCLVEHKGLLFWLSALPFVVTVGLSLLAAVAALLRLACLGEDQKETHASRLRSYAASTAVLASIVSMQWAPAHSVQIEDTGLSMAFLFFLTTLLQGPIMLLLFVVYSRPDRKAMALGLARGERKMNNILADLVRPPHVGDKVGTDEQSARSFRDAQSRTESVSITRLEPLEMRRFSEAPVV